MVGKKVEGYLGGLGSKIQRCRIRNSSHGSAETLPANHIDGHHKLIRWRVVVHGGVDGFSRLPVYLQASTNNTAETVLQCFLNAVSSNGLPSRVRCDKGGENVKVSQYMLCHLD